MNSLWAVLLGVLQGFTEFLPVSSSGHLVLAQSFIPNFEQPGVLFDVILHLGTLFAILLFFRARLKNLELEYLKLLLIASIPAAFVGLLLGNQIESLFASTKVVGVALIVTALFNFLVDSKKRLPKRLNAKNTFLIGLAQAFAVIPGISRSGSTIFAGVSTGIKKSVVAEFSFLLSVPAVFGAALVQILKHGVAITTSYDFYIVGFLSALVSGYIAINLVLNLLSQKRFKVFGVYCLILGVIVLLF